MNIPKYVDSSETPESWDIYSSMFGGIPNSEIDELKEYWDSFPSLKSHLFKAISDEYSDMNVENIENEIIENADVKSFITEFYSKFESFRKNLKELLIDKAEEINIQKTKNIISEDIFERLKNIKLIDKYQAYQILDDHWSGKIDTDLEIIQTEGFNATKQVDPNMVIKKKDNKEVEVQEGWVGHILPFELVQKVHLSDMLESINTKTKRMYEITSLYQELYDLISDDDKTIDAINTEEDKFVNDEVLKKVKEINSEIKCGAVFEVNSLEDILIKVADLIKEEKILRSALNKEKKDLHIKTKELIESLTDQQVVELLKIKWIETLVSDLEKLPYGVIRDLTTKVLYLSKKYIVTYSDIENQIRETEKQLIPLIDELEGNEYDMKGLEQLKKLLGGCIDA